jgi:predicted DNA-binding ribbon-helix-helix protein
MEYNRPTKHSLTLRGHRTSVSLEQEFWDGFRNIADAEGITLNALGAQIDTERGVDCGLASAIRLFVFHWYQDQSN